jgi:hypothetical protein
MTTCKKPVPQSFPQADGSYTRNFCMADACGNVYSVCETYTVTNGVKTVDTLLINGQAATSIPAELVPSDCPQKVYVVNQPAAESAIDREMQILCAPDGTRVVIQNVTPADAPLGTAPTFETWNLDGSVWLGAIGTLVACNGSKLESDPQIMCDAGVTFLRHFVKSEGEPTGVKFDTTLAGVPYVVTDESLVSVGECPRTAARTLIYLEKNGGVLTMADIVAATGATKVMSVTVKQISGNGNVKADAGGGVPLSTGEIWSWNTISDGHSEGFEASALNIDAGGGEQRITATYV